MLAVASGTGRTDDHFLDDLLALPARIVRVAHLAFASLARANERIGAGTIRVFFVSPFQDKVLGRSTGRHDALTHLTTEHENEPME